ncbi:diacylglycerol/lipid kinase family protein [Cellulomonas soli]
MSWEGWVAVVAVAVALGALTLAALLWRREQDLRRLLGLPPRGEVDPGTLTKATRPRGPLVAVVANPTKPDVAGLRIAVRRECAHQHLPEPLWFETTAEEPGTSQAREALEAGADVVLAAGGDGTVRAVAEALVGSGVPMGLLPLGTGNLLARNLDLPLSDQKAALRVALTGVDRTIDVGRLRVLRHGTPSDGSPADDGRAGADEHGTPRADDHLFLVIAGLGFDAAMVADTDEQLKAKVGWIAYFVAGIRHLHGRRTRVHVRIDDATGTTTRLRSLLIGNCGRLPGGLTLLPDAVVDDGWLDIAAIDTRAGVAGWAQLFGEVVLQGVGVRNELPAKIGRIDHTRARSVRVVVPAGEHVQVDGEVLGVVRELSAWVDPGALVVRVPV